MTKLSVLDQTPVIHGHSTADAIAATLDLAQLADDLGFTRYWCAEHLVCTVCRTRVRK